MNFTWAKVFFNNIRELYQLVKRSIMIGIKIRFYRKLSLSLSEHTNEIILMIKERNKLLAKLDKAEKELCSLADKQNSELSKALSGLVKDCQEADAHGRAEESPGSITKY